MAYSKGHTLYLPRWSADIIEETKRTLENRLGLSTEQTAHLLHELKTYFGWINGYRPLIPAMANHPRDRHLLAAAVRSGAQTVVAFKLKDIPSDALEPLNIEAQSPDEFLIHQFHLNPVVVNATLMSQAEQHGGWGVPDGFYFLDLGK